ncbi:hypothetical protein DFH09DRAFT_1135302 [Mycena vulgaris]|nr:hypothetical protein DFH09DRAFT_1135302 [Mycena vulgaris]
MSRHLVSLRCILLTNLMRLTASVPNLHSLRVNMSASYEAQHFASCLHTTIYHLSPSLSLPTILLSFPRTFIQPNPTHAHYARNPWRPLGRHFYWRAHFLLYRPPAGLHRCWEHHWVPSARLCFLDFCTEAGALGAAQVVGFSEPGRRVLEWEPYAPGTGTSPPRGFSS